MRRSAAISACRFLRWSHSRRKRAYVIEVSSYQIDLAPTLRPTVGILLNVTEDHLDRHGSMDNYAAIKERLPANVGGPGGTAVICVDDHYTRAAAERIERAGKTVTRISVAGTLSDGYFAEGTHILRADVYGLGATVYACLTGRDAPEAPARLLAQTGATTQGADLKPVRSYNPQVSVATEKVVKKALELSPQQRQQTAADLQRELQSALNGLNSSKGAGPATMDMGPVCARCGVQNHPGLLNCANCGAPVGMAGDSLARGSAKRAAKASPGASGVRGTAKVPAMPASPAVVHPLSDGHHQQTKETLIAAQQRSSKHAAVAPPAMRGTGKQPAVGSLPAPSILSYSSGGMASDIAGNTALAPRVALTPANPPARMVASPSAMPGSAASGGVKSAWIKVGATSVGGVGKAVLAFGFVELLWGALIIALGVVMAVTKGNSFPVMPFVGAWLIIVLLASLIGGQAISRPVYRRKRVNGFRRGVQGLGLLLYAVVVHAVAIWGVTTYSTIQSSATVAIIAFVVFGLNVLVIGIFTMVNMLNN